MHDALPLVVGHHEAKQNIHQTHHSKRKINTAFTGVQINHDKTKMTMEIL